MIPSRASSPARRSLTSSALWLLSAKTLGFGFMFLLPVLLVRTLSLHDFGVYKQVFLVVGTAISLLPLGFGMSAYYFLPRLTERRGRVVFNILVFHLGVALVAAAVLTFKPEVLGAIFSDPGLTQYAPLIGLIVLLWIPSSCLETIVVADGDAPLAGKFIVGLQLTKAVLLLAAAWAYGTISALVLAAIVHGLFQSATLLAYLSSRFSGCWREADWSVMRAQLAYALPHGAAALLYWFQVDLHRYFVAHQFDAETFAIYAIGCFELPMLGILSESVGSVLIPRMSELQRDGRRQDIVRLSAAAVRKLAGVHVPLYALLTVVGFELITLLFTARYQAAWPIFAINMTLIPFSIPTIPCDAVIRAYAEHRFFLVKLRLISTTAIVGGLWFSLDRFGLVGAIGVVVGVNLLERIATTIKAGRILGVTRDDAPLFADTAKIAAASGVAALAAYAARGVFSPAGPAAIVAGCAMVLAVTYLAVLVLLRVPSQDEWDLLTLMRTRLLRMRGGHRIEPLAPDAIGQPESRI